MSDQQQAPEYPPPLIPTVYADSVINMAFTNQIVKFYLARNDQSITDSDANKSQIFAQIIMPMDGFVHTALFFEYTLRNFVARGMVPRSQVMQIRAVLESSPVGAV